MVAGVSTPGGVAATNTPQFQMDVGNVCQRPFYSQVSLSGWQLTYLSGVVNPLQLGASIAKSADIALIPTQMATWTPPYVPFSA